MGRGPQQFPAFRSYAHYGGKFFNYQSDFILSYFSSSIADSFIYDQSMLYIIWSFKSLFITELVEFVCRWIVD
jgi:hypothetical protein